MEKRVLSLFIFSLLFAIACRQEPKQIPVTGITLSQTSVELTEGESTHISATVSPNDATNQKVIWSSDSPFVTVSDGYINGIKPCIATVTATTDDGGKTATCIVKVIAKTIAVTGISLDITSLEIKKGDKATLNATVYPNNATDMSFFWSSSNEYIATVSSAGLVNGVSPGSAIITATTVDGGMTATCTVKVIPVIITPTAIDLGLSVNWASFNVGATKPEDFGDYYAWGEIEPYYSSLDPLSWRSGKEEGYTWSSYRWVDEKHNDTKYCGKDGQYILTPSDDVASVEYGYGWRIPTSSEYEELSLNCIATRATKNGTKGILFTSKNNGNSIFLPFSGGIRATDYGGQGKMARYWSSNPHFAVTGLAIAVYMVYDHDSIQSISGIYRSDGYPIRPVCPKD